ncbi:hypothetical protein ACLOJK_024890 [Asimina triloba]
MAGREDDRGLGRRHWDFDLGRENDRGREDRGDGRKRNDREDRGNERKWRNEREENEICSERSWSERRTKGGNEELGFGGSITTQGRRDADGDGHRWKWRRKRRQIRGKITNEDRDEDGKGPIMEMSENGKKQKG